MDKVSAWILIVVLIVNLVLFAMQKYNFWVFLGIVGIVYVIMKVNKSPIACALK